MNIWKKYKCIDVGWCLLPSLALRWLVKWSSRCLSKLKLGSLTEKEAGRVGCCVVPATAFPYFPLFDAASTKSHLFDFRVELARQKVNKRSFWLVDNFPLISKWWEAEAMSAWQSDEWQAAIKSFLTNYSKMQCLFLAAVADRRISGNIRRR